MENIRKHELTQSFFIFQLFLSFDFTFRKSKSYFPLWSSWASKVCPNCSQFLMGKSSAHVNFVSMEITEVANPVTVIEVKVKT